MKRNSELGFVVGRHLAVFAAAISPPNAAAGIAFGGASALPLVVMLFFEVSP
ncbi:hypothetical protein [Salinigranum marinum]|uniref:hypothetical protein n=1 Tax=Salinigranum marinum TaxID=1515595 RepID=UPI002989AF73|nr:hypothetical protein [Salinigranum marinum]